MKNTKETNGMGFDIIMQFNYKQGEQRKETVEFPVLKETRSNHCLNFKILKNLDYFFLKSRTWIFLKTILNLNILSYLSYL